MKLKVWDFVLSLPLVFGDWFVRLTYDIQIWQENRSKNKLVCEKAPWAQGSCSLLSGYGLLQTFITSTSSSNIPRPERLFQRKRYKQWYIAVFWNDFAFSRKPLIFLTRWGIYFGCWRCWSLWYHQQWSPSWILPRIRNQVKTARNGNFLCYTWKITHK